MNFEDLVIPKTFFDFRHYYTDTGMYLSLLLSQSIDDVFQLETLSIGAYFGNINGEISEETIVFINNVLHIAKVTNDDLTENKAYEDLNEIKGGLINSVRNWISNEKGFHNHLNNAERNQFVFLEVLENEPSLVMATQLLKVFYYRFALKIIEIDGDRSPKQKLALQKYKQRLFGASVPDITYDEVEPDMGIFINDKIDYIKTPEENTSKLVGPSSKKQDAIQNSFDELITELNSLVGLNSVKTDIDQLVNFLKIQQLRHAKGMKIEPISRHLVFYGNPGTGKTTVARLISKIYQSLGIISKGHLIEIDRAGLVAGYVGQTAIKVNEVVNKSLGGVLFIDEAYTLSSGGDKDYGQEAIDSLLKLMEDHRDDLIVIVAGYSEKMDNFLSSNPGLRSRFNKFLNFEDYNPDELTQIFELFCDKSHYTISPETRKCLLSIFTDMYATRDHTFGNGRLVRNIFEMTINNQANRIVSMVDINEEDLINILDIDLPKKPVTK